MNQREYAAGVLSKADYRGFGTSCNADGELEIGAALEALEPADRRLYRLILRRTKVNRGRSGLSEVNRKEPQSGCCIDYTGELAM